MREKVGRRGLEQERLRDQAGGDHMSIITCSFSRGTAPLLQMKLDLDPDWPAEKSILNQLQTLSAFEPDVANAFVRVLREGDPVIARGTVRAPGPF